MSMSETRSLPGTGASEAPEAWGIESAMPRKVVPSSLESLIRTYVTPLCSASNGNVANIFRFFKSLVLPTSLQRLVLLGPGAEN